MPSAPYDIELGGKGYILMPGGYQMSESPKSFPAKGVASSQEFQHPDNWSYWGQSDWAGEGIKNWTSDGPFETGWGLDLSTPGEIKVARKLTEVLEDPANSGGYVPFAVGTTRVCFLGKSSGNNFHSVDGTTWTIVAPASTLGAGVFPRSVGDLKGVYYVSASNGKLFSTTDGTTYTDKLSPGPTTDAWILGSFKSKLYVGYANKLYTYDGTTWTELFANNVDGTPIAGCVGSGGIYFVTDGPNSRLYLTDGNALHQLAIIQSDFKPKATVFLETVYIFGHNTDDANTAGAVWRLTDAGLVPIFEFGDDTADFGIRSAILDKAQILWGANRRTGVGVFDPSMDISEEDQRGFYVSSVASAVTGVVHGIVQFGGRVLVGVQGDGIYRQDTPGTFRVLSCSYDADARNLNKTWGFAEIRHSALTTGQSVTLKTTKNGTTLTSWGASSTVGDEMKIIAGPSSYKHPFLQYELTGDANGADLKIFDVSLAYIETSDNPKREWDLVLAIEGSSLKPQKLNDRTNNDRTAATMFSDLNALWNTVTTFKDIDNTVYNVVMKMPRGKVEDFIKDIDAGSALKELAILYRLHLTQL